jgi:hypothetical protein
MFKIDNPNHRPIVIPGASASAPGMMSAADKAKLDSIPQGGDGSSLGWFDIRDYDAEEGGIENCTPAFAAAFAALVAAGGGTIYVPPGVWSIQGDLLMQTEVGRWSIVGAGSSSRLKIDSGAGQFGITIGNARNFELRDVGVTGGANGPTAMINIGSCRKASISGVEFSSCYATQAVVYAQASGLVMRDNFFYGVDTALCLLYTTGAFEGLLMERTSYEDVVNFNAGPFIGIGGPIASPPNGANENPSIIIRDCFCDELAGTKISINSANPSSWWDRVTIEDCNFNVTGETPVSEIDIRYVKHLEIRRIMWAWAGHANNNAINLVDVDSAIIDGCNSYATVASPGSRRVVTDSACQKLWFNDSNLVLVPNEATVVQGEDAAGTQWRGRFSQAAIVANTLVKPGATAGRVDQLGTNDAVSLAQGVALDAASGAGQFIRVIEKQGQMVSIKSDGAGTVSPGEALGRSGTSGGRVAVVTSGNILGRAYSSAAASADALVNTMWSKEAF